MSHWSILKYSRPTTPLTWMANVNVLCHIYINNSYHMICLLSRVLIHYQDVSKLDKRLKLFEGWRWAMAVWNGLFAAFFFFYSPLTPKSYLSDRIGIASTVAMKPKLSKIVKEPIAVIFEMSSVLFSILRKQGKMPRGRRNA